MKWEKLNGRQDEVEAERIASSATIPLDKISKVCRGSDLPLRPCSGLCLHIVIAISMAVRHYGTPWLSFIPTPLQILFLDKGNLPL